MSEVGGSSGIEAIARESFGVVVQWHIHDPRPCW